MYKQIKQDLESSTNWKYSSSSFLEFTSVCLLPKKKSIHDDTRKKQADLAYKNYKKTRFLFPDADPYLLRPKIYSQTFCDDEICKNGANGEEKMHFWQNKSASSASRC